MHEAHKECAPCWRGCAAVLSACARGWMAPIAAMCWCAVVLHQFGAHGDQRWTAVLTSALYAPKMRLYQQNRSSQMHGQGHCRPGALSVSGAPVLPGSTRRWGVAIPTTFMAVFVPEVLRAGFGAYLAPEAWPLCCSQPPSFLSQARPQTPHCLQPLLSTPSTAASRLKRHDTG